MSDFTNGSPWNLQYDINEGINASSLVWTLETSLPVTTTGYTLFVTKSRVYILGITSSSAIYSATIDASGNVGTWTLNAISFPFTDGFSRAVVIGSKVYVIGGYKSTAIYSSVIDSNGLITSWVEETLVLPEKIRSPNLIVTKNRLYILGGYVYSPGYRPTANTYSCAIASDDSLGSWTTEASIPVALDDPALARINDVVYLIGGITAVITGAAIYSSIIDADGYLGSWSTETAFPQTTYMQATIVTKEALYQLGGTAGTKNLVYKNLIDSNGSLTSWILDSTLPDMIVNHAFTTSTKLYAMENTGLVMSAPFNGGLNDYTGLSKSSDVVIVIEDVEATINPLVPSISSTLIDATPELYLDITARTFVLDAINNHGSTNRMGIRSIDFYLDDTLLVIDDTNSTSYATTNYGIGFTPELAFNTSLSKIDSAGNTSWLCGSWSVTNQRLCIVFDSDQTFNRIVVNNYHNTAAETTYGVSNAVLYYSTDAISSIVFEESLTNSTEIFSGSLPKHTASNLIENYEVPITLPMLGGTSVTQIETLSISISSVASEFIISKEISVSIEAPLLAITSSAFIELKTVSSFFSPVIMLDATATSRISINGDIKTPGIKLDLSTGSTTHLKAATPVISAKAVTDLIMTVNMNSSTALIYSKILNGCLSYTSLNTKNVKIIASTKASKNIKANISLKKPLINAKLSLAIITSIDIKMKKPILDSDCSSADSFEVIAYNRLHNII